MTGTAPQRPGFPGGTAVSHLTVYDWPTPDGLAGGSPHLHTASGEGYVVVAGAGRLQTLSSAGFAEHPLEPGVVLWFTPGTVHRLVNEGGLEIVVVMQNAGLPEAGDAVFTFPDDVLADPRVYAEAAALPGLDVLDDAMAEAARRRRDLAIEGFSQLRARLDAEGPAALTRLYERATALVTDKVPAWRATWDHGVRTPVEATGRALSDLEDGRVPHLADASVHAGERQEELFRFGMCGRLRTWDVATH
ncbi:Cupin domain-containing protein [Haloactinopolyspora alba]|uniref:Cupin domain-containing protein n=1 Tax=Haloactinopolyspora alba TaxID=648780 RepID=A0A2P8EBR9_9ACTN|nr:cupin domain-containing protein [Haloactinopolyspora alba]PSL06890.1 Cupin domain-containing protein [Haloactinopolyspora alba]